MNDRATIAIRAVADRESAALATLLSQSIGLETSTDQVRARLRKAHGVEPPIVAVLDDEVAGFASVRLIHSLGEDVPYAEVTELFVAPEHRRRGIGEAAWLVPACVLLGACAHEPPPAAYEPRLVCDLATAPPDTIETARDFLPADAVLIANVAVAELDALGFAEPLLGQLIDPERAAEIVDHTLDALIAVSPNGASTHTVLVLHREGRPADAAAWQRIGARLWLACIDGCDGYAPAHTTLAFDALRDGVAPLAPGTLAHVQVAIARDPAVDGVRARLLDSSFSVLSELHAASLDLLREGDDALRANLSARFGSQGLASNATLLLLGVAGSIADRLEAAGLQAEADRVMALHTELALAPADTGEMEKAELRASLTLPLTVVPVVALAFRQTHGAR